VGASGSEGGTAVPELQPFDVATRLAVLPDRAMRAARLAELLRAATPDAAAWLLDALATAGRTGPPYTVALLAAVDLVGSDRLADEERAAIELAAESLGLLACRDLLLPESAEDAYAAAAPRALVPGTRPLTLGERKALARSWHRDTLQRLLVDPHVEVVTLLLANPHVTEEDVLRIATARRSSAAVLARLLESPRWSTRVRVRRALVGNPRLPLPIALRLVGLLSAPELRDVALDPNLRAPLRAAIDRRLRPVC
jgi:hypothetical protein